MKPVLKIEDKSLPFELKIDTLLHVTGTVLWQQDTDRLLYLVAFLSQSLNTAEQNYQIYDKEMLTIMLAL